MKTVKEKETFAIYIVKNKNKRKERNKILSEKIFHLLMI